MTDWKHSLKELVRGTNARRGDTDSGGFFFEWDVRTPEGENILSIYFDENGSLEEATIGLDGDVSYIGNYKDNSF